MLACEDLKHGGVVHHGSLPAAAGLYGGSLYPQLGYLQLPASALDLPPSAQGPLGAMGPWSSGSGAGRGLGASPPSPPAVPAYNTTSNRGCPDPSTSGGHHSSDGVTAACKKPSNAQKRFRERQKVRRVAAAGTLRRRPGQHVRRWCFHSTERTHDARARRTSIGAWPGTQPRRR